METNHLRCERKNFFVLFKALHISSFLILNAFHERMHQITIIMLNLPDLFLVGIGTRTHKISESLQ